MFPTPGTVWQRSQVKATCVVLAARCATCRPTASVPVVVSLPTPAGGLWLAALPWQKLHARQSPPVPFVAALAPWQPMVLLLHETLTEPPNRSAPWQSVHAVFVLSRCWLATKYALPW